MNKLTSLLLACAIVAGCHRAPDKIEPKINYAVQDKHLKRLPSPFPPLTAFEKEQPWGIEYQIGLGFAHQLDLYQSITAFKRAAILVPQDHKERKLEIEYEILFCYYLGKKYSDVVYTYENSDLPHADQTFPAIEDLLIILNESYLAVKQPEKAKKVLELLNGFYPQTGKKLAVADSLLEGDIDTLRALSSDQPYLQTLLTSYDQKKKSVTTAKTLNALLPGAGYLYLGQRQSAFTALLLNGLFIGAATYFFLDGNVPAGAIFTSFETGWYFGGIVGAGQEAKLYNERTYEKLATPMMNNQDLFPVLMLKYAF